MNKKTKIFITLTILLAFICIIFYLIWPSGTVDEQSVVIEPDISEVEILTKDEIAVQIEECNKQTDFFQSSCFSDLAYAAMDKTICEKVTDIHDTGYGGSYYYISKGMCYGRIGADLDYDYSICDNVTGNVDEYSDCMVIVAINESEDKNDPASCDVLKDIADEYRYTNCVAEAIAKPEDLAFCDLTANETEKSNCMDMGYGNLAVKNDDISYCQEVESSIEKSICIGSYAEEFDDLSACHTLSSDTDICVCYNMYFDELNDEVCSALTDETQKQQCNVCKDMNLYQ